MALHAKTQQQLALAGQYFRGGRPEMAEAILKQLLAQDAGIAPAWELLAYIAGNRGDDAGCEQMLRRATSLPGCSPEAFFYLGRILLQTGSAGEAIPAFQEAMARAGEFFEALHELGVAHSRLGEHRRALECLRAALRMQPRSADTHFNIGRSLEALNQPAQALASYDAALQLDAAHIHAWANRGVALAELGRNQDALASYDRALALHPEDADTLVNKANVLANLQRHQEALGCLETAARLAPGTPYLQGSLLHARMHVCEWDGLDSLAREIVARIGQGEKASIPFPMLATPADARTLLACARTYALDKHPAQPAPGYPPRDGGGGGKIRLGYFSADFHNHATSQLMARLFECHDRTRFELHAFAFGRPVRDAMRERLVAAFDSFTEVHEHSDADIAALARTGGIDIAIDLKGFTQDARPGIFAHRAAPIQVNYLGFPGSMGCDFIDYIVADDTLVRDDELDAYAEKVLRLPGSYQVNDNTKPITGQVPDRAALGLPQDGFVFACFNNNYKITPAIFDVWMRLLAQVPGSVLWLFRGGSSEGDGASGALQAQARARGVDPARLVWAERMPLAEHLARHAQADLFLDTPYCNAHTTCSDALWAGLPVLTLAGDTFASRVAASLLRAAGLPELVTHDFAAYENAALDLARSPQRLAALRERLSRARTESPLFDTPLFARRIERAYAAAWSRHLRQLAPVHMRIEDGPAQADSAS
ncbi:MAG: tetratricopeptide repeat protein [Proteobacteria bacterium]|nr:tetratricopeptide repeat protein [Pseudomonadota bacterium]